MMRKRSSSTGKAGRMDAPPTDSSLRHGEALQAKNHKLAKELVRFSLLRTGRAAPLMPLTCRIETTVYVPDNIFVYLSHNGLFCLERMSNETPRGGQECGSTNDGKCTYSQ
jgi:hypothetical protein